MRKIHITQFEATLDLGWQIETIPPTEIDGPYLIARPPMPPRRRVSIEEFEADMRAYHQQQDAVTK